MYQAIRSITKTLQECLDSEIKADPVLGGPLGLFTSQGMSVSNLTPKEMEGKAEGLSVWLYRVLADDQRLNDPPIRLGPGRLQKPPLPVRLHYLITPLVSRDRDGSVETEQYLLGKVLQIFYSKPVLQGADLRGELSGTQTQANIRLETMSLDEITRVWDALEGSYQLSVSYEVSVVNIDSATQPVDIAPVKVVLPGYGVITGGST